MPRFRLNLAVAETDHAGPTDALGNREVANVRSEPKATVCEVNGHDVLGEEGLAEVAVHDHVGDHDGAVDGDERRLRGRHRRRGHRREGGDGPLRQPLLTLLTLPTLLPSPR
mgnify:CR=1 FL=1